MSEGSACTPRPGGDSSHLDLLRRARDLVARARALRTASESADVDELHGELCALRNALAAHVQAESPALERLSPAARTAIVEGQRRLLREVEAIMTHAAAGDDSCDCVGRSVHLVSALATQARVEAGVLSRRARHDRGAR